MKHRYKIIGIGILLCGWLCTSIPGKGQQSNQQDVDSLFEVARKAAFAGRYEEARTVLDQVLNQNPNYDEVRIFKARTFSWEEQFILARKELKPILDKSPSNEEAISAITDIEIWDKNFRQALVFLNIGLKHYPDSEDLLYKKAWSEYELKNFVEARSALDHLFTVNLSHVKGKQLLNKINNDTFKNSIGLTYGLDVFDRTYRTAQYLSVQWMRSNKWGTSILKLNHAHRFGLNGLQPEIDLYPKLTRGTYLYLNYGYSQSDLFPMHRLGGEFYSKIPKRFEVSAGVRFLNFSSNGKVLLYTGSVGVYFKNYWLSFRPFIVPLDKSTGITGTITCRKYFENANNYVGVFGSAGYSPEDNRIQSSAGLSPDGIYELKALRFGVTWQSSFRPNFIVMLNAGATRQELAFEQGSYVWISNLSVALRKRF